MTTHIRSAPAYPSIPTWPRPTPPSRAGPTARHNSAPTCARRAEPSVLAAIALGGRLGAPARYGVAQVIHVARDSFPWATFWTNISGSLALGLILALILERFPPTRYLRPFVATGFLGAYTTYSTFAVETDLLIKDGHAAIALAYARPAWWQVSWRCGSGSGPPGPSASRTDQAVRQGHLVSPLAWVAFVAAAGVGAPLRYLVDGFVGDRVGSAFPWGTFLVNVSGSLLLGGLTGLALYHGFPKTPRVILGTGFCGAYTTFSTFSFETVRLLEEGALGPAFRNALGTLITCGAAAALGLALAAL